MAYVVTDAGLHCARHGESFGRTGECRGCVADPGAPDDFADDPLAPPPIGCMSTVDVEREYVAMVAELGTLIRSITGGTVGKKHKRKALKGRTRDRIAAAVEPVVLDLHAYNTIAKLMAERSKALGRLHDCASRREDEAVVARRDRERLALEQGAAH